MRRRGLWIALITVIAVVILTQSVYLLFYSPNYSIINTSQELHAVVEAPSGNKVFLDLRKPRDYEQSHITGARSVPFKDNDDGEEFKRYLAKNQLRFKDIYLYCYSGKKSAEAYNLLLSKGYKQVHAIMIGYEDYIVAEGNTYSEGAAVCEPCKEKQEGMGDE